MAHIRGIHTEHEAEGSRSASGNKNSQLKSIEEKIAQARREVMMLEDILTFKTAKLAVMSEILNYRTRRFYMDDKNYAPPPRKPSNATTGDQYDSNSAVPR